MYVTIDPSERRINPGFNSFTIMRTFASETSIEH